MDSLYRPERTLGQGCATWCVCVVEWLSFSCFCNGMCFVGGVCFWSFILEFWIPFPAWRMVMFSSSQRYFEWFMVMRRILGGHWMSLFFILVDSVVNCVPNVAIPFRSSQHQRART